MAGKGRDGEIGDAGQNQEERLRSGAGFAPNPLKLSFCYAGKFAFIPFPRPCLEAKKQ